VYGHDPRDGARRCRQNRKEFFAKALPRAARIEVLETLLGNAGAQAPMMPTQEEPGRIDSDPVIKFGSAALHALARVCGCRTFVHRSMNPRARKAGLPRSTQPSRIFGSIRIANGCVPRFN
jgi:hypothetical protein